MGAKHSSFKMKLLTTSVLMAMGASHSAISQEQSQARVVEEVLVTATKRETSLQDTPLAISAISGETLVEKDIVDLRDLRGSIPNLQFVTNQGHATPLVFLRGLGTLDQTEAGDQGIAFYVDGVYAARSQGTTVLMYDMERVEVLRGPQGTLFGRNSTGGAISLHSAKPILGEFEASTELTVGSNNRFAMKGMVNMPLTENWSLRFAGAQEQRDGLTEYGLKNVFASEYDLGRQFQPTNKIGEIDSFSYRISSLYEPTDSFRWYVAYESFRDTGSPDALTLDYDNRVNEAHGILGNNLESNTLRTRADLDITSDLTLSYIGGTTAYERQMLNADQFGNMQQTTRNDHDATQHELQLANGDDNRLRWTAGLYYFEESNFMHFDMPVSYNGWGGGTAELNDDDGGVMFSFYQPDRGLESASGYFQGTFDITDTFRTTLGARYTEDTRTDNGGRSIDCTYRPDTFPAMGSIYADDRFVPAAQAQESCYVRQYNDMEDTWDSTTYTARFEYDVNDDIMAFISYSTGWKSGVLADGKSWEDLVVVPGFENVEYQYREAQTDNAVELEQFETAWAMAVNNPDAQLDFSRNLENMQEPEEVSSLEIGIKSQFDRLTLNANIFFMDFQDMQVTSAVVHPITQESVMRKTNAGSATSQGLELEGTYLVGDNGTLSGSFSYLDASYDEFFTADDDYGAEMGRTWNTCANGVTPEGECVGGTFDFSGNQMPYAPEFQFQVSYKHEFQVGDNRLLVPRVSLTYFDDMYFNAANRGDRPADFDGAGGDGAVKDIDRQPAYGKLDLGLTYKSENDNWSIDFFAKNVTDEAIRTSTDAYIGGTNSVAATYEEGRAFGVRVSHRM